MTCPIPRSTHTHLDRRAARAEHPLKVAVRAAAALRVGVVRTVVLVVVVVVGVVDVLMLEVDVADHVVAVADELRPRIAAPRRATTDGRTAAAAAGDGRANQKAR